MKRLHLGDALDFWKRAMLDLLRASQTHAGGVKIVPMFTDGNWQRPELDLYSDILGCRQSDLLSLVQLTASNRTACFSSQVEDVFVDPDTGIRKPSATGSVPVTHVDPAEVRSLLSQENVVAVYQHARREGGWLDSSRDLLLSRGVKVLGYQAGQVGMLFATRSTSRNRSLRAVLSSRLAAVAAARLLS